LFFQIDFVKNRTWLITLQSQIVWRRNPKLIFVASRSTYQSIILIYSPSYLPEITIIQPKHQKKDNTTRPILHPFLSDSLLPIFESFTTHHLHSCFILDQQGCESILVFDLVKSCQSFKKAFDQSSPELTC
jgi:hypothetical protein